MAISNKDFDYFDEALKRGWWSYDGRFCILGIRTNPYREGIKQVLVFKEATWTIMWQNIYQTKKRQYVNKAGEKVRLESFMTFKEKEMLSEVRTNLYRAKLEGDEIKDGEK